MHSKTTPIDTPNRRYSPTRVKRVVEFLKHRIGLSLAQRVSLDIIVASSAVSMVRRESDPGTRSESNQTGADTALSSVPTKKVYRVELGD